MDYKLYGELYIIDLTHCGQAFISTRKCWASSYCVITFWLMTEPLTVCIPNYLQSSASQTSRIVVSRWSQPACVEMSTFALWHLTHVESLAVWISAALASRIVVTDIFHPASDVVSNLFLQLAFPTQFDTGSFHVSFMDLARCGPNCILSLKHWDVRIFLFIFPESYLGSVFTP